VVAVVQRDPPFERRPRAEAACFEGGAQDGQRHGADVRHGERGRGDAVEDVGGVLHLEGR